MFQVLKTIGLNLVLMVIPMAGIGGIMALIDHQLDRKGWFDKIPPTLLVFLTGIFMILIIEILLKEIFKKNIDKKTLCPPQFMIIKWMPATFAFQLMWNFSCNSLTGESFVFGLFGIPTFGAMLFYLYLIIRDHKKFVSLI